MSLHRETAFCLSLVTGHWREVLSTLTASLDAHNRLITPPASVIQVVVGAESRMIVHMGTSVEMDLIRETREEEGNEHWICAPLEARIGRDTYDVDVWLHAKSTVATEIVLNLASELFESVRRMHEDAETIDEAVKFDMLQLFTDTALALGAQGFGYRSTREDSVPRPPHIESLLRWIGLRRTEESGGPWIVAGVDAAKVDPRTPLKFVPPYLYERDGFVIYDLLLPPAEE